MTSDALGLPDFSLTLMLPSDLDAVAAVEAAAQLTPWSRQLFADCLGSDYLCQVVRHQETLVAFQVLSFVLDESHLLNIAVAPAFQRRGIARALLTQGINKARARSSTQMFLEVRANNHQAQALYTSLGFEHLGLRRNYYRLPSGGREDAWVMLKAL